MGRVAKTCAECAASVRRAGAAGAWSGTRRRGRVASSSFRGEASLHHAQPSLAGWPCHLRGPSPDDGPPASPSLSRLCLFREQRGQGRTARQSRRLSLRARVGTNRRVRQLSGAVWAAWGMKMPDTFRGADGSQASRKLGDSTIGEDLNNYRQCVVEGRDPSRRPGQRRCVLHRVGSRREREARRQCDRRGCGDPRPSRRLDQGVACYTASHVSR